MSNKDWAEQSQLVLHELSRLDTNLTKMDSDLQSFREETKVALAKVQARQSDGISSKLNQGFYGIVGGSGGIGILALLEKLFKD